MEFKGSENQLRQLLLCPLGDENAEAWVPLCAITWLVWPKSSRKQAPTAQSWDCSPRPGLLTSVCLFSVAAVTDFGGLKQHKPGTPGWLNP